MSEREIHREELAIYVVVALCTLPVVIATVLHHGAFAPGATVSLLLLLVGVGGVLRMLMRRLRMRRTTARSSLPTARLRQPAPDKVPPC